jgi:hypothetical protein
MKKNDQITVDETCLNESNCTVDTPSEIKEVDVNEKIYNALEMAEKIAVKLAQINQILKKAKKKKKKKNKKLGKVDKKTGTLILKKEKKEKNAKPLKRYSPPKK